MKSIKIILSLSALSLFLSNSIICKAVHGEDLYNLWELRHNIYAVIFLILSIRTLIEVKGICRIILTSLVIFCAGDVVDRLYFNENQFVDSDYSVIGIAILVFVYQLRRYVQRQRISKVNNKSGSSIDGSDDI